MPRLDPEAVGDRELARVFVAPTLAEARRAEAVLSEQGIEYVVQPEPLSRSLLGSPRYWAAFYVETAHARYCGAALTAAGLAAGVLVDEHSEP